MILVFSPDRGNSDVLKKKLEENRTSVLIVQKKGKAGKSDDTEHSITITYNTLDVIEESVDLDLKRMLGKGQTVQAINSFWVPFNQLEQLRKSLQLSVWRSLCMLRTAAVKGMRENTPCSFYRLEPESYYRALTACKYCRLSAPD